MMLGGVLIAPDLLKLVDVASTTAASMTSVYMVCFPAPVNDYTTTVIPVLISVPVLWRKWSVSFSALSLRPWRFRSFRLRPCSLWFRFSLCITAPAGSYLGMLLGQLMFMLGNSGGIVSLLTLMGLAAGWEFLKIAGVSNVVLSLAYAQFMSVERFVHSHCRDNGDVRRLGHALLVRRSALRIRMRRRSCWAIQSRACLAA